MERTEVGDIIKKTKRNRAERKNGGKWVSLQAEAEKRIDGIRRKTQQSHVPSGIQYPRVCAKK